MFHTGEQQLFGVCTKEIRSGFVHPCCTNVSRIILKTNKGYYHTNNKLQLDRVSPPSSEKAKIPLGLPFIHTSHLLSAKKIYAFFSQKKYFSYSWPQEELRVLFIKS